MVELNEVEKKLSEQIKELARRMTDLNGRINRLDVIFEHNRSLNNRIVNALQTGDTTYALAIEKEKL